MADDAIGWMNQLNQIDPNKPFFIHYVPALRTRRIIRRRNGWTKSTTCICSMRAGTSCGTGFLPTRSAGVIPANTQIEPWPTKFIKNWDDCTAEEKKLYIKQVEVFAAFAAYNDYEIGRVIQASKTWASSITRSSFTSMATTHQREGGPLGTPNEVAFFNGVAVPVEAQMKFYEVWGTEQTYNHMSAGWSWAFDTPFTWFKQNASRLGGSVSAWLSRGGHIKDRRAPRAILPRH